MFLAPGIKIHWIYCSLLTQQSKLLFSCFYFFNRFCWPSFQKRPYANVSPVTSGEKRLCVQTQSTAKGSETIGKQHAWNRLGRWTAGTCDNLLSVRRLNFSGCKGINTVSASLLHFIHSDVRCNGNEILFCAWNCRLQINQAWSIPS